MAEASPSIAIVDDDPAVLKALSRLLRSHAFRARTYESGQQFLAALPADLPDCLIVDLQMPAMNGLELQQHLVSNGIEIPTILITAHGDAALCDHRG
jgi:FixJ family two-component response regulator